ncbi:MAG: hypothetical protein Q7T71_19135 [Herbiconiux sp.]|nr:hypothetical protein [Herbiconiux sp.]
MAVGFWVLYLVVRSAVLWALRAHAEDVSRASHRATEADTADR